MQQVQTAISEIVLLRYFWTASFYIILVENLGRRDLKMYNKYITTAAGKSGI